ncbi:MAG: aspartate carbamoyltransferase catalytic subunit [Christensenellales bacterium]|jgi:aspartate carbamoyltransferase catalytic subunit
MPITTKDMLGLRNADAGLIAQILDTATEMKRIMHEKEKKCSLLSGKLVVTLFYENSTRTRTSFETAAKLLSATASSVSASNSSVQKGESLIDTGHTLQRIGADILIIRHPMSGAAKLLAENVKISVINAGDGTNEHPTQALLDMFTMRERFGALKGLNVAIVGDILHSRVARSNLWGLKAMGARVTFAGPGTLLPAEFEQAGARVTTDVRSAVKDADVVMALRIQKERQQAGLIPSVREYAKFYGIDDDILNCAKPGALVMHPGPINRGVEITGRVADSPASTIDDQVENGVAVRMALLTLLSGRSAQ